MITVALHTLVSSCLLAFVCSFQSCVSSISNLRPVHETFKSICAKVLAESETEAAPLKLQISEIEASWNNMVQNCEIKSHQAAAIERPSSAFYDKNWAFADFLTDAEARMDMLGNVPSTLKEAEQKAKDVKVRAPGNAKRSCG